VLSAADPFVYAAASRIPDDPDRTVTSAAAKPPAAGAHAGMEHGSRVGGTCILSGASLASPKPRHFTGLSR
jgi:hypothetical protein